MICIGAVFTFPTLLPGRVGQDTAEPLGKPHSTGNGSREELYEELGDFFQAPFSTVLGCVVVLNAAIKTNFTAAGLSIL